MKIWIKFLIGSIIGLLLGFYLPDENGTIFKLVSYTAKLFINIGRYALFPLIFFSLVSGTNELKQEKKILKVYGRTIGYLLISTLLLVLIGTLSVFVLSPERIPIIIEEECCFSIAGLKDILLMIFPKNIFNIFINSGNFLLPMFIFAFFLGSNLNFDSLTTKPVIQIFNSFTKIFYRINNFIIEIIGIGMIPLSAFLVMQLNTTPEITLFKQLFLLLSVDSILIIFIIYPAILYFFGQKENPYKWIYALTAPAISGFISGDNYFCLSSLIKNGKENMGIPRKVGSATFPLFALFGKAGTAMVTSISFIIILKSYSSLGINFQGVIWVIVFSFLVSFLTGAFPGLGTFVSLSILCALYGKGLEEGYLILKPAMPLLISFSVFLDAVSASLASMLIAQHEGVQKEIESNNFV